MEEENKLPLKRVELSLTKFNEVAIPHHLDLLRQHKANILKYEQGGQYARVRSEQAHARRVAAQLRALLGELDALRRQVRAADLPRFDRLTERARDLTLRAVVDYLDAIERGCVALQRESQERTRRRDSSPVAIVQGAPPAACAASTDSVGLVAHCDQRPQPQPQPQLQVQLEVDEQGAELAAREAALRGWGELQGEVRALHGAWGALQAAAQSAREPLAATTARVDVAADSARDARTALAGAERLRGGAYAFCGCALGALLGGPAGLLLGAKAGLAVGLAAGGLGWLGGRGVARGRAGVCAPEDKDL